MAKIKVVQQTYTSAAGTEKIHVSYWKSIGEMAKLLNLARKRLHNLRKACRNSGWTVESIRAIESCTWKPRDLTPKMSQPAKKQRLKKSRLRR